MNIARCGDEGKKRGLRKRFHPEEFYAGLDITRTTGGCGLGKKTPDLRQTEFIEIGIESRRGIFNTQCPPATMVMAPRINPHLP